MIKFFSTIFIILSISCASLEPNIIYIYYKNNKLERIKKEFSNENLGSSTDCPISENFKCINLNPIWINFNDNIISFITPSHTFHIKDSKINVLTFADSEIENTSYVNWRSNSVSFYIKIKSGKLQYKGKIIKKDKSYNVFLCDNIFTKNNCNIENWENNSFHYLIDIKFPIIFYHLWKNY